MREAFAYNRQQEKSTQEKWPEKMPSAAWPCLLSAVNKVQKGRFLLWPVTPEESPRRRSYTVLYDRDDTYRRSGHHVMPPLWYEPRMTEFQLGLLLPSIRI